MKKLVDIFIQISLDFRDWFGTALEPRLPLLYFIAAIISIFLLWLTIYVMISSGWARYKYDLWSDILGIGDVGKRRQLRGWTQILKRLQTEDINNWKTALLEADAIFDEILKASGYRGDTIHDRFNQLPKEALSVRNKIVAAHEVRDRILQASEFIITQQQAIEIAKVYQQAFRELGLID